MKWGCCGDLERLRAIETAGYDFIESPVRVLCVGQPASVAQPFISAVRSSGLSAEAFNVFVPGDLPIIGPDVNENQLRDHVETVVTRLSVLGTSIIVLGSGGARNIPEGWDRTTARKQFISFCERAADVVSGAGITIVIEPLVKTSCNYIHTVSEARGIASEIARPEVAVLADLYHMHMNGDPIPDLAGTVDRLEHVHLPVPGIPGLIEEEMGFDHFTYLSTLKNAGYSGRISVEDNGKRFHDFEREAGPGLEMLKQIGESA